MIGSTPEGDVPITDRRNLIKRSVAWISAVCSSALLYPLLKFSGYRIQARPRFITVPGPLPSSGYHTERDFILFDIDGEARALSRTCTHLGCRVNYHADKERLECPCHQSQFTTGGIRIDGPAQRDLPVYPVEVNRTPEGNVSAYVVQL